MATHPPASVSVETSVRASVQTLLTHPDLWRADRIESYTETIGTGYPVLDSLLAGRGWPKAGLVELLSAQAGIGELRLLSPALAALSIQEQRWQVWIDPPHIPYAPALAELGIDISKVLLVRPKTHADALWALEQSVKSGTCSAALAWLDDAKLVVKDLRRLKLAARRGGTLAVLFRPDTAARRQSMAELRIQLHPAPTSDRLRVKILKRRGGWATEPVALELRHRTTRVTRRELREQLLLWRAKSLRPIAGLPPLLAFPEKRPDKQSISARQ
jgi:cell division inhibitor SulA